MGLGGHGHGHGHHGEHGHSHSKPKSNSHGHSHSDPGSAHSESNKFCGCCTLSNRVRITCMLGMTFSFFLVELIAGQITKSISLTTDSFHMLSDALALVIGLISIIMSQKKTTKNTFGWVRAEILGALVNSVFLVSLCLGLIVEAIERLFEEKEIHEPKLLLIVGSIGFGINLIGLFIFGHAHSHDLPSVADGNEEDQLEESVDLIEKIKIEETKTPRCHIMSKEANMNMRAVFLHVLADALGSVIVIISALLNIYQVELKISKSKIVFIDPFLCLTLVILILASTIPLLKESALILLQTVPKEIEIKQLSEEIVEKINGIISVHELHVWKLSGSKIIATAHVTCHNSVEYMRIATDLKELFHKRGIHSTTIQPEFTDLEDGSVKENCIFECKKNCEPNTCCGQTNQIQTQTITLTSPNSNNQQQQIIEFTELNINSFSVEMK